MEKRVMRYTLSILDFILMMLGILSFGIGSVFGFTSAPAIAAVSTPNVGSAQAENGGDGGDDDDDDRDDTVPTR
jgi:hypothetical protein